MTPTPPEPFPAILTDDAGADELGEFLLMLDDNVGDAELDESFPAPPAVPPESGMAVELLRASVRSLIEENQRLRARADGERRWRYALLAVLVLAMAGLGWVAMPPPPAPEPATRDDLARLRSDAEGQAAQARLDLERAAAQTGALNRELEKGAGTADRLLRKELAKLKRAVDETPSREENFAGLEPGERPPLLNCTGPKGADAKTVRAAQLAWVTFLGEKGFEKRFDLCKDVPIDMVLVPPGRYYQGDGAQATLTTIPQPMWVGKYEVTQMQYMSVTGEKNPSGFKKAGTDAALYPVEHVEYVDADKFCRCTRDAKFRMLRESEWEYAYRAGTRTKYYHGDTDADLNDFANYNIGRTKRTREIDKSNEENLAEHLKSGAPLTAAFDFNPPLLGEGPVKIGSRKPNAFGLHDMAGNVEEWCAEWGVLLRMPSMNIEDKTPVPDSAVRGGSAYTEATDCQATHARQVAILHRLLPFGHVHQCHQVGFRVCIPIDK